MRRCIVGGANREEEIEVSGFNFSSFLECNGVVGKFRT